MIGTTPPGSDECEHHPEKLAFDAVEWDLNSVEDLEFFDDDIFDAWEEQDAEILDDPAPDLLGVDEIPF